MEDQIHTFLLSQLPEEPEMTSALMIYTLNKDREKAKVKNLLMFANKNTNYTMYTFSLVPCETGYFTRN